MVVIIILTISCLLIGALLAFIVLIFCINTGILPMPDKYQWERKLHWRYWIK